MRTSPDDNQYIPGNDEVLFVPLGGSGEIGMNMNLFGHAGQWLMVDCGLAFADEAMSGIDLILPDPTFIAEQRDRLAGLLLTHAHEDHFGAVPYLWDQLRCPIYATPFAATLLRAKLQDEGVHEPVKIVELELGARTRIGPFEVELATVTHSIPEPCAVILRTDVGTVLHTGDWKIDPTPPVGEVTDEAKLRALGAEGVTVMLCDSTNALSPGRAGSEMDVLAGLKQVFADAPRRIAVTCFASNVARIDSIARAAHAAGRHVALVGRSLWRVAKAAQETGYLNDLPQKFLTPDEAAYVPEDKIVLICTGSQGQPRSALQRMAAGNHPELALGQGDLVIFSSRHIPGNEKAIGRVENQLIARGCRVLGPDDAPVHVSGHPCRDELTDLYSWVRPQAAIPVHGELRHMLAHAELAQSLQVPHGIIPGNGDVIRIAPGAPEKLGEVQAEPLVLDGYRLRPMNAEAVGERQRMGQNGAAMVTVVLDKRGKLLSEPQITVMGLADDSDGDEADDMLADIQDAVSQSIRQLGRGEQGDDNAVRGATRAAVRRVVRQATGRRPVTDVHVVRLG